MMRPLDQFESPSIYCWEINKVMATEQHDQTILIRTLSGHKFGITAVAVTPEGQRAVSASWDNTLKVWDLASGRELNTLSGHTGLVAAVAVIPDGRRAISASGDNTLKVWDLATGRELHTLSGHTGLVTGVSA